MEWRRRGSRVRQSRRTARSFGGASFLEDQADRRASEPEGLAEIVLKVSLEREMYQIRIVNEQNERRWGYFGLGRVQNMQPLSVYRGRAMFCNRPLDQRIQSRRANALLPGVARAERRREHFVDTRPFNRRRKDHFSPRSELDAVEIG